MSSQIQLTKTLLSKTPKISFFRNRRNIQFCRCFSSNYPNDKSNPNHTPITIIGGGPSGLLLSILLSSYNVPSTLFERKTEDQLTSHPQAHFINLRTMEILRHCTDPEVTEDLWKEVPPVEEWQDFRFGHSILGSGNGRCLGLVRHPVTDGGSGFDGGKARLIENSFNMEESKASHTQKNSICNVAHIGQHKFCNLLIQEAKRAATKVTNGKTTLNFNTNVTSVQNLNVSYDKSPINIHHWNSTIPLNTDIAVATEGAHSPTRTQYGISMVPNPNLDPQHLMNVHFKVTSPEIIEKLRQHPAMLYFIYNETMISVFICHDMEEGNWVMQIPYMPPYQSPPSEEECYRMLYYSLLGHSPSITQSLSSTSPIQVVSIRPWVMTGSIAKQYLLGPSRRIILAGDAAHTFPPAGGFGMNTGLQDVHNLAWRLALYYYDNYKNALVEDIQKDEKDKQVRNVSLESKSTLNIDVLLGRYESERQPIAQQNEALSVRNYNRTVQIAQTLGLDIRLSKFANEVMSSSIGYLVPMTMKKKVFENAFQLALKHLSWFRNGDGENMIGNAMSREMRKRLRNGEGLPLIFPRFELGFSYENSKSVQNESLHEDDTARYIPTLKVGGRMPHCPMEIISTHAMDVTKAWPNLIVERNENVNSDGDRDESMVITLTDIASQMRKNLAAPCFAMVLAKVCTTNEPIDNSEDNVFDISTLNSVKQVLSEIYHESGIAIELVEVQWGNEERISESKDHEKNHLVLKDRDHSFRNLVLKYLEDTVRYNEYFVAVLIRPDGHVAHISQVEKRRNETESIISLKQEILLSFDHNCGILN